MIHSLDTGTCHWAPKIQHSAQRSLKAHMAWGFFQSWRNDFNPLSASPREKGKKNPTCVCSSEWACCPSPIPHHAAQTSAQGQVHAFQREKINLDPAVVQLKDISHSYIFNKVDLFLLLPRKLVLRCTQIITYCGTVNYYKCTELKQPQVWARFSNVLQMFMVCCKTFVKLPTQHSIYWRILARGNSFSLHRCCIPEIFCLLIEDWWNSTLKNYNERNQILSSGRGEKKPSSANQFICLFFLFR